LFTRHAVLVVDPVAKIHQLAALGAERAMRIVFPLDWLLAGWTLSHNAKVKRKKAKVKAVKRVANYS
jgi:hypothetical protein